MACSVYWVKPFAIESTMNTMNRPYAAMLGAPSRAPYLSLDLGPWHKIQSNRSLRCTFALGHGVVEHVTHRGHGLHVPVTDGLAPSVPSSCQGRRVSPRAPNVISLAPLRCRHRTAPRSERHEVRVGAVELLAYLRGRWA